MAQSSSRYLEKVPDMQIASLTDLPLTLLCLKVCKWCWNAPAQKRDSYCSDQCKQKRKAPELHGVERVLAWDRERGKCVQCGLDTVALAEAARIEYLKGGLNAKKVYCALWYGKGYRKEDFNGIAWRLIDGKTVCLPCFRFAQEYTKRTPSKAKFKQPDLFGG